MNICCTGISQGLGYALTRELLAHGHSVWGIARNQQKLRNMEQEISSPHFFWTQADVTDHATLQQWKEAMKERLFVPDCLILNASIQEDDLLKTYNHNIGLNILRTNLEGSLDCISLFLPDFLKNKKGRIIHVGSTAILRPSVRSAAYSASKAGMASAIRALHLRYRKEGLSCGQVILGPVATDMWEGKKHWLVPSAAKAAKAIATFTPSKKKTLYYPRISTTLLRVTLFLSDPVFATFSSSVLK